VVTDAAPVYPRVLDELIPTAWHHVERIRIGETRNLLASTSRARRSGGVVVLQADSSERDDVVEAPDRRACQSPTPRALTPCQLAFAGAQLAAHTRDGMVSWCGRAGYIPGRGGANPSCCSIDS
jgi:hypothetical protein